MKTAMQSRSNRGASFRPSSIHSPFTGHHSLSSRIHSPFTNHHSPSSGFTIIEILLALALSGTVLGVLYAAYSAVTTSTRNYDSVSDIYQTARIVLGNMSREISGAFQPLYAEDEILFAGETKDYRGGAADRLSLVTTTCLRGGEEETGYDAYELTYYRGFGMKDGLLLMKRSPYYDPEEPFEEGEEVVIADHVRALDFAYYDGEDWLEEWDGEIEEKMPRAVRITLGLAVGEEGPLHSFSTVVHLPLAALTEEKEEEAAEEKT